MSTGSQANDHVNLQEDLAAYALGALADSDARAVEDHLERCEDCRSRLRSLRSAVDLLPAAVPQHTPPARLREGLMATVRAEADAAQGAASAQPEARQPWWTRLRGAIPAPAVALAATLLLIAGVGTGYLLRGSDPSRPEVAVAPARALNGADVSATLERHDGVAILQVSSMPKIGADKVYEIWLQRSGVMEPSNIFVLNRDGTATAAIPGPLGDGEAIYVTKEPRGGSQQPTSAPLLQAEL
jgi:anti-sigma-K factor RskA